jgi:hypothetical protein
VAAETFHTWLNTPQRYPGVWLPSISESVDLSVKPLELLKLSGDGAKHNFTRLDGHVGNIRALLARHHVNVEAADIYDVLADFYDQFDVHFLWHHHGLIAESLNNIRWGIYDYLKPTCDRVFVRAGDIGYRFDMPNGVI